MGIAQSFEPGIGSHNHGAGKTESLAVMGGWPLSELRVERAMHLRDPIPTKASLRASPTCRA